jgi:hypothetical protein
MHVHEVVQSIVLGFREKYIGLVHKMSGVEEAPIVHGTISVSSITVDTSLTFGDRSIINAVDTTLSTLSTNPLTNAATAAADAATAEILAAKTSLLPILDQSGSLHGVAKDLDVKVIAEFGDSRALVLNKYNELFA